MHKERGFSLIELLIVMVVGGIVLGAATMAFKDGTDASNMAAGREDALESARGALNLIAKDVSMAGAGLPTGGLALPYGAGASASLISCPQTGSCYLSGNDYPSGTVNNAAVSNYMYGLIPAPARGIQVGSSSATIPATGATPDGITVIYEDFSCQDGYTASFPNNTGGSISAVTVPAGCPTILSPTGIQVGDLILLTNPVGSAVGEVTGIAGGGSTIDFANSDPLEINQSGAPNGNIKYLTSVSSVTAARIWAVSYFIDVQNGQPPRLMRQVSGQTAVPVADNIIGMNFTYDLCDGTNGPNCATVSDPIAQGYSPNNIYKVNIELMAQSTGTFKSQSTALTTSVMTRNLSYKNRY
jgi:prepilin-type N-terminal cleavage/methylation domain-containing protein